MYTDQASSSGKSGFSGLVKAMAVTNASVSVSVRSISGRVASVDVTLQVVLLLLVFKFLLVLLCLSFVLPFMLPGFGLLLPNSIGSQSLISLHKTVTEI
jgi:hypothetical protein